MSTLIVATWNLEAVRPRRSVRTDHLRGAMAAIDPDIWVLTESHPDFPPGPRYDRLAMSSDAPDRREGGRWVVIWVRDRLHIRPLTLKGEPERSAGVEVRRNGAAPIAVFGTVLPWRGDTRYAAHRGGAAFRRSIELRAGDWARAADAGAELCIAGDLNQEYGASGPVGTRLGSKALVSTLASLELTCATGGLYDPLLARGWRRSIDHILLSRPLHSAGELPRVWPGEYPLPKGWPDHYGVAVILANHQRITDC